MIDTGISCASGADEHNRQARLAEAAKKMERIHRTLDAEELKNELHYLERRAAEFMEEAAKVRKELERLTGNGKAE